jgi:DNA-binding NarL/FixJ family response regulator
MCQGLRSRHVLLSHPASGERDPATPTGRAKLDRQLAMGSRFFLWSSAWPQFRQRSRISPRERQVMDGLIGGLSNKLIARDYDISPRTIEVYRANVMTKMQAGSLSELVRLAIRAGVLKD